MSTETESPRKGYAIFVEEITDWDRYLNEYLPRAGETVEDHGGTLTVWNEDPDVIEGEWKHNMTVVVEFPSVEDARAWYSDPVYEEVMPIRHEACEYAHAILTPEFSPDDLPG
jgi:uncharacterized protein (DUF1330 family)